jgi:undecaprenyl-diphosphatase
VVLSVESRPDRVRLAEALVLALIHGPTELLPISSSAHTTLVPLLAGWPYAELDPQVRKTFEVALHAGAGAALAIDMRDELRAAVRGASRDDALLIASSLAPPALAGWLLGPFIARRLSRARAIAAGLCAGSLAMVVADRSPQRRGREDARVGDGIALGLAQAAALAPGVSRSGATLAAARARGFTRAGADSLSRHAGLAVIFVACAREAARLAGPRRARGSRTTHALGAAGALVSTSASLRVQRRLFPSAPPLWPFAVYRLLIGALIMRRRAI